MRLENLEENMVLQLTKRKDVFLRMMSRKANLEIPKIWKAGEQLVYSAN